MVTYNLDDLTQEQIDDLINEGYIMTQEHIYNSVQLIRSFDDYMEYSLSYDPCIDDLGEEAKDYFEIPIEHLSKVGKTDLRYNRTFPCYTNLEFNIARMVYDNRFREGIYIFDGETPLKCTTLYGISLDGSVEEFKDASVIMNGWSWIIESNDTKYIAHRLFGPRVSIWDTSSKKESIYYALVSNMNIIDILKSSSKEEVLED